MMTRTKMHSTKQNDPPAGLRIHPNGTVEVLTEREAMAESAALSARRWLRRGGRSDACTDDKAQRTVRRS